MPPATCHLCQLKAARLLTNNLRHMDDLLSHGNGFEVLELLELREKCVKMTAEMLKRY